ncbi:MAG: ribonuclease III [Gammaproteobacteria bacterium]|jgi:ribonuclease-3
MQPSPAVNDRIGYRFSDDRLLERALTHRSASRKHNERLEFLGDAVLNFLIAEALYQHMPEAREGELTRWRASLVRRQTLATLARELALGRYLKLGSGEIKTRGAERDSILADAFEAVIGAVYLDGGLEACRAMVLQLFAPHFFPAPGEKSVKDPKTRLQEAVQSQNLPLPTYAVVHVEGAAHEQRFTVACQVSGVVEAVEGFGSSRRRAEQEAARKALALIEHG